MPTAGEYDPDDREADRRQERSQQEAREHVDRNNGSTGVVLIYLWRCGELVGRQEHSRKQARGGDGDGGPRGLDW